MNRTLLDIVREVILEHALVEKKDTIVIAMSGGIDSTVLFHLFLALCKDFDLHLAVAHCNYGLRGTESDEDEHFVRSLAEENNIQFFCKKIFFKENEQHSLQERAREIRYHFFQEIASSTSYKKIATGHTLNDNAETVLFNFLRGSGVRGLCGIPLVRKNIIRPLLYVSRTLITEYVNERSLAFRTDSSNAANEYTRNIVRNQLVPLIEREINPNVQHTLFRESRMFFALEDYLQTQYEALYLLAVQCSQQNEIIVETSVLKREAKFLQQYFFYNFARNIIQTEVSYSRVENLLKFSESETGSSFDLTNAIRVYRDRGRLIFCRNNTSEEFNIPVEIGKEYRFLNFVFSSHETDMRSVTFQKNPFIEYIDAEKLKNKLVLRQWNEGEYFYPLGMKGKKKVSDFFTDEKIPKHQKRVLPILASDGNIVWICGKRLDERYKLTKTTTRVVQLEFSEL
jgi:tRNA(Ile)-lysidine synthase